MGNKENSPIYVPLPPTTWETETVEHQPFAALSGPFVDLLVSFHSVTSGAVAWRQGFCRFTDYVGGVYGDRLCCGGAKIHEPNHGEMISKNLPQWWSVRRRTALST